MFPSHHFVNFSHSHFALRHPHPWLFWFKPPREWPLISRRLRDSGNLRDDCRPWRCFRRGARADQNPGDEHQRPEDAQQRRSGPHARVSDGFRVPNRCFGECVIGIPAADGRSIGLWGAQRKGPATTTAGEHVGDRHLAAAGGRAAGIPGADGVSSHGSWVAFARREHPATADAEACSAASHAKRWLDRTRT